MLHFSRGRIIAIVLLLSLFTSCKKRPLTRPNIIWMVWEDMSPDIGCYGNSIVNTSVLNSMAGQGVRYMNVYTNGAVCTPSRTSIALGMYQDAIGGGEMRLPDSLKHKLLVGIVPFTSLLYLKKSGYTTANIGDKPGDSKLDWDFKLNGDPFQKHHWDESKRKRTFFAYINLFRTHRPFKVDAQYQVPPDKIKVPSYYPDNIVSKKDFANYYGDMRKSSLQNRLINGMDITATTLSLAGIKPPSYMQQGIPFLGKYKAHERSYAYGATDQVGGILYITDT